MVAAAWNGILLLHSDEIRSGGLWPASWMWLDMPQVWRGGLSCSRPACPRLCHGLCWDIRREGPCQWGCRLHRKDYSAAASALSWVREITFPHRLCRNTSQAKWSRKRCAGPLCSIQIWHSKCHSSRAVSWLSRVGPLTAGEGRYPLTVCRDPRWVL